MMTSSSSPSLPPSPPTRELTLDEFDNLVVLLYADPTKPTVGYLADYLGVGYSVVYRALKRQGVRRRLQGPSRVDFIPGSKSAKAATLLVTNSYRKRTDPQWVSQAKIARQVGCTRELVKKVLDKLRERGRITNK
jgi:DNA-binding MarR family transcriptional regulator